jgi:FixJ family two-component response regulator
MESDLKGTGMISIAVVDDDESIRDSLKGLLNSVGYSVETFESAELFLDSGVLRKITCLILDVRMPGMNGLELQSRLKQENHSVPVVFVTAHDSLRYRRKAFEAGALEFLPKPFDGDKLIRVIQSALSNQGSGS